MNWMLEIKCPKCGSDEFRLEEYVEVTYVYSASKGKVAYEGTSEDAIIKRVNCYCEKCRTIWHPKKSTFD